MERAVFVYWNILDDFPLRSGRYLESSISQFSGLLDKNGKEIYEGDVIEFMRAGKKKRVVVEWDEYDAGFRYITQNPLDNEIIGNIYENPELLKE